MIIIHLYVYVCYICVYIYIYIYIYTQHLNICIYINLERVKLNSLTFCQKRESLLKNKLKQRGKYNVLKYLVFDENVRVKWCKISNYKSMGDM